MRAVVFKQKETKSRNF